MMVVSCYPGQNSYPHSQILSLDFYNYFQYGIDILLSGTTHTVKKIILHSNIVRRLFAIYWEY